MKKIPSLFKRDYTKKERPLLNQINKECEWVIKGQGIATRKFDGTCCLIKNGKFYKRYTVKKDKTPPEDFIPATIIDPVTGKREGWRPVRNSDKYHMEAYNGIIFKEYINILPRNCSLINGTFELCGPKIQGNPERFEKHILIKHGCERIINAPRDFEGLKTFFLHNDIEGIVWHHPDGRMAKIKGKDFGINRSQIQKTKTDMLYNKKGIKIKIYTSE